METFEQSTTFGQYLVTVNGLIVKLDMDLLQC